MSAAILILQCNLNFVHSVVFFWNEHSLVVKNVEVEPSIHHLIDLFLEIRLFLPACISMPKFKLADVLATAQRDSRRSAKLKRIHTMKDTCLQIFGAVAVREKETRGERVEVSCPLEAR